MITTIYRDMTISYDENNETWNCQVGDKWSKRTDLKDCKKAIDKFLDGSEKLKKKFDRLEVLRYDNYSKDVWNNLTITSITNDGIWTTDANGHRNKFSEYDAKYLYLKTDANLTIIEKIKQVDTDIKAMQKKREDLRVSLETLNPKKILQQLETA